MNYVHIIFKIYCITILTVFTSFGMNRNYQEDVTKMSDEEIVSRYIGLCAYLTHSSSWYQNEKGDWYLHCFENVKNDLQYFLENYSLGGEVLFNMPIDEDNKRFIHFLTWRTTRNSNYDYTISDEMKFFWDRLRYYKANANIQDNNGDTPLHYSFLTVDVENNDTHLNIKQIYTHIDFNSYVLRNLLILDANPYLCNDQGYSIITDINNFSLECHHIYNRPLTGPEKALLCHIKDRCNQMQLGENGANK